MGGQSPPAVLNSSTKRRGPTWGTAPVAEGVAEGGVHGVPAGEHEIVAVYSGTGALQGSTTAPYAVDVQEGTTCTVTTSSPNPSTYGQSVTFTATPNGEWDWYMGGCLQDPPTGPVEFYADGTWIGEGILNSSGQAPLTVSNLAFGTHAITATYGGDTNYSGSTSAPLSQEVDSVSTTTTVSALPNPVVLGQPVTLTATIVTEYGIAPGGWVYFYDGDSWLGTCRCPEKPPPSPSRPFPWART